MFFMYCFGGGNKCCIYFYEALFCTQMESFPLFCELLIQADPLWQEKKLCDSDSLLIGVITVKKSSTEFCEAADGFVTKTEENN